MFFSWQFWLVFHAVFLLLGMSVAAVARSWWAALFMCVGVILGAILAVVPLWVFMELSAIRTGFDAGNAGVFFVCTVPTFPVVGLFAGGLLGNVIDNRRTRRIKRGLCPACAYPVGTSEKCTECGKPIPEVQPRRGDGM